jgi:TPR repeat protein
LRFSRRLTVNKRDKYQQMMAMHGDYFTYTNDVGQTITIRKLIYGIPCAKISARSAVAVEKQIAESQKKAIVNAAVKFNEDAAQRGDAYGLLRMGERYRDGDGVEKDLGKAKIYLSKAADAGSTTAADELSRLTGN